MYKSKIIDGHSVTTVTVMDPESHLPVDIEIIKLETGGMIGVDSSYIEQDIGSIYSPFDQNTKIRLDNARK